MKSKLHKTLLIFSALFILNSGIFFVLGLTSVSGLFLVSGLIALALAVRGFQKVKGFSYTLWIFTAVTASMFSAVFHIGRRFSVSCKLLAWQAGGRGS